MKRSIRQALRWTLVVTLASFVGISPASAGWLLKRMRGCESPPACCVPDPCCEPAPVCGAPEPTCCTPATEPTCGEPACCEPGAASASHGGIEMAPFSESVPMAAPSMGESVIQGDVIYSEPAPMMDLGMGLETSPPAIEDIRDVESPELQSDSAETSSAKPPADPGMADPGMADSEMGESVVEQDNEPSPFQAPPEPENEPAPKKEPEPKPEPKPEPTPEPKPEPAADASMDDLFGGEPEPAPKSDSVDDLFGAPPAVTEPPAADEPAMPNDPAPADAGLDDLFGGGDAAEPAMPADPPAGDAGLDDLFGAPSDAPAGDAPADDGGLDSLFGDPPAMETPAPGDNSPSDGGLDDLFGEPPANENGTSDLDDLFGKTKKSQPELIRTSDAVVKVVSEKTAEPADILANTEIRSWTDNTGLYQTVGKLIQINEDHIRLLKSNGKTCTVPMDRLSQSDSDYVSALAQQAEVFVFAMNGN